MQLDTYNFAFYVLSPKSAVKSAGESDVYSLQLRFLWLEVKFFYDVCLLSLSELLFHALFHKCLFSSSWLLPHSATQQRHIDEIIILLLIIYSLTKWFRQDMNNYICAFSVHILLLIGDLEKQCMVVFMLINFELMNE